MKINVEDLIWDELSFNEPIDTGRYARAKDLYRRGCVTIKHVERKENGEYNIDARVEGNYDNYAVELKIDDGIITYSACTCEDNNKGYICKHIIATSFETASPHEFNTQEGKRKIEDRRKEIARRMEEERKRQEYNEKYQVALGAIDKYKKFSLGEETNDLNLRDLFARSKLSGEKEQTELSTKIHIEPRAELYRDEITVSFRIGENKYYVLKDLNEFYNAYKEQRQITYGKNFACIPKREYIDEKDKELFDFLINYIDGLKYSEDVAESRYSYHYISIFDTKAIHLKGNKIDQFFEIIKKNKGIMVHGVYHDISEKELDIKLSIEETDTIKAYKYDRYQGYVETIKKLGKPEKSLRINTNIDAHIKTDKYVYVLSDYKIYTYDLKEHPYLPDLLSIFRQTDKFLIPQDKLKDFSTYVMPKFEKYITTSMLDVPAQEGIFVNKLASKILLDLSDEGDITMELRFCYADFEFNVLDSSYKDYVEGNKIVRNIPEEEKVIKRIFSDGFEYKNGNKLFFLSNEDKIYEFLVYKIEGYMNDFEVLVTDKLKNRKVKQPQISSLSIKLDNGLLEVDLSKMNIDLDEIQEVLKNYTVKKKYYKLKSGDFLSLEQNENLDLLLDMGTALDINFNKLEDGTIKLPVNRSLYLERLLENRQDIKCAKNDSFMKIINSVEKKNFSDDIAIDKDFENVLRDYQKTGYKWLKVLEQYGLGGILADDMGLGKTLQVIALLKSVQSSGKPSIVVCPSSLTLNWLNEVNKWCNLIKALVVKGDAETRKALIETSEKHDLIITSYDSLKRDVFEYENKLFKYIIADEAQYIKNFSTQNATALKSLKGENCLALTGTPIENSVSELWSIFDFIMPGYLYNYNKFKKKFEEPILKDEDEQALNRLKCLISPFILRRVKKDVLQELPEKNITVMKSEMTGEQEKVYNAYFAQTKKEMLDVLSENGFQKGKFKILMLLTRLRQICCHPSLFIENYKGGSGKLAQCMDLVKEAISAGHKILLFSSYTSMFEIIEKELEKENIAYYKLTGATKVDQRIEMVENFNKNEDIKIFLISLKAGGTGLNLTGADVVIHFDPWWNISSENQATDRAYRIGQKNSVQVYKLITGNTIEEKINKLQEKKAKISEDILSTEETFINTFSKEEIMDLFNEGK